MVIPFTLCSLLLCHHNTGERARVAHRRYPGDPGSRQENRRFAVTLSLFLPAFGSGAMKRPCKSRPLGASMRLAPAYRKRFGDFRPDHGAAVSFYFNGVMSSLNKDKNH